MSAKKLPFSCSKYDLACYCALFPLTDNPLSVNNLAISLAQQHPPPSLTPNDAPTSAAEHLSDARQWGLRALALASSIKPPERTEECDEACAVATINLGDFAMMEGDLAEARKRFEEGKSLSKAIGFPDGIGRADESIKELQKRTYAR